MDCYTYSHTPATSEDGLDIVQEAPVASDEVTVMTTKKFLATKTIRYIDGVPLITPYDNAKRF